LTIMVLTGCTFIIVGIMAYLTRQIQVGRVLAFLFAQSLWAVLDLLRT